MTIAKGFLGVAAFKHATVWGTPVAAGAGDGLGFVSESMSADVALIEDQQIEGSSQQRAGEAGNRLFAGEVETGARYEGLEPVTAHCFGTAGTPTTIDTSGRVHTLKLANDLTGTFGTLAIDKGFEVWEYTTVKVVGITFSITQGERASITYRFVAHNLNINTSSGTNNNTSMASVTYPANREYLQFKQMVVRANAASGGALGASNVVYVNGLSIEIDRAVKDDDVTTQHGDKIDEPIQDDWTTTKVSLELSKYQDGTGGSDALMAAQLVKTAQKMDIVLTGASLAGAATELVSWKFFLNSVQFQSGTPNISGPGLTPWTLEGMAYRVLTAPTGFTAGHTDGCTLVITSQRTTDALA